MIDENNYKRALSNIGSSSEITLEGLEKRKHAKIRKRALVTTYSLIGAAVLFAGSNATAYAMNGEPWITSVFKAESGIEMTIEDIDEDHTQGTIIVNDDALDAYYDVEDDKLFFTFKDTKQDITDQCSDTDYFKYDYDGEDGLKHTIIIGATPENPGYVEYAFDKDGKCVFDFNNLIGDIKDQGANTDVDGTVVISQTNDEDGDVIVESYTTVTSSDDSEDPSYVPEEAQKPDWLINAEKDLGIK